MPPWPFLGLCQGRAVRGRGRIAWAWVSGLHPHTFGPAPRLLSPQGRAFPPPLQTGSSALLGSVRTSPFDSPFLFGSPASEVLVFGEGGGGFLPPTRTRFPAPKAGLGAPSGRKWGRAHPRGGACGRGAPFPAPAGPAPLPLALAPRLAGLQPPGRDTGGGTLSLEQRAPGS